MEKFAAVGICPRCKIKLGSYGEPTWTVREWPVSLRMGRLGDAVDLPQGRFAIVPVVCSVPHPDAPSQETGCGAQLEGDLIVAERLGQVMDNGSVGFETHRILESLELRAVD